MKRILTTACGSARAAALLLFLNLLSLGLLAQTTNQPNDEGLFFQAGTTRLQTRSGAPAEQLVLDLAKRFLAEEFHFTLIHIRTDATEFGTKDPEVLAQAQRDRAMALKSMLGQLLTPDQIQVHSSLAHGGGSFIHFRYMRRELALDSLEVARMLAAFRQYLPDSLLAISKR